MVEIPNAVMTGHASLLQKLAALLVVHADLAKIAAAINAWIVEILAVAMVIAVILGLNVAEMVIAKSKEEYAVLMAITASPAIIAVSQNASRKVAENLMNLE